MWGSLNARSPAGTSVTGLSLRNRDLFFPSVLRLFFLESLLNPLDQRIPKRDPSLVSPDIALLVQLLHQASRVLPGAAYRLANLRSRLRPLVSQQGEDL